MNLIDRKEYQKIGHEYLIEQINNSQVNNQIHLDFNHPVKELLFIASLSNNLFSKDEIKKIREEKEINDLCNKFNKICIPNTYDEYIAQLSDSDKNTLEYIL